MAGAKFNRKQGDVKNYHTGYTNKAYMAYLADFTSLEEPTVSTTEANKLEIITDHTFTGTLGFAEVYVLPDSAKKSADTYGDIGGMNKLYKAQFFMPGESSDVEAMSREMLNRELILLLEETDSTYPYVQLGNARTPAVVTKVTEDSGTQFGGTKGYLVEVQTVAKYYYSGAITLQS